MVWEEMLFFCASAMYMHFPCARQSTKMHRPVIQIIMRGKRWMDGFCNTISACAKLSIINLFHLSKSNNNKKLNIYNEL